MRPASEGDPVSTQIEKKRIGEETFKVESPRREKVSESSERDAREWTKERLKKYDGLSERQAYERCKKVFERFDRIRSEKGG